jgi:hypothetical protein
VAVLLRGEGYNINSHPATKNIYHHKILRLWPHRHIFSILHLEPNAALEILAETYSLRTVWRRSALEVFSGRVETGSNYNHNLK